MIKSNEECLMLNSMFFERVLGEVGRVVRELEQEDTPKERELSYQEGKAFLCFQIYRQNIHNPKLLEIAEKRIESISELRKKWESKDDINKETKEDVVEKTIKKQTSKKTKIEEKKNEKS